MELVPGVYSAPQTIEREGVENTIHPALVETAHGVIAIDVGYPGLLDQFESNLSDTGHTWDDVWAVLLTHQDGDHAGSLSAVLERTNAVVMAHERCSPYITGEKHPIKAPEGERFPPAPVDLELIGGETFRTTAGPMTVHFTPGHAPGHLVVSFPAQELLLAADALTADETGLAGPSEEYTLNMEEALESAASLADLNFSQVLCYHGGLVEATGDDIRDIVAGMT